MLRNRRVLFALATAALPGTDSFLCPRNARGAHLSSATVTELAASQPDDEATSVCDVPLIDVESLVGPGGARQIMSSMVTDADGTVVRIDDAVDKARPNVVVFLRHMGWPYCWAYARDVLDVQQELESAGVGKPIFISIGDVEKLSTFLNANDFIPRDQMFVDDYTFNAYRAAGFGRFDQLDREDVKDFKMTAPEIGGFRGWLNYFGVVSKVSPIPKDMKFGEVPEGVLWVGGTFVIKGDEVLYQWSDKVPGNHPDIREFVNIAKAAAA